jgi:hypothetical protein
MARVPKKSAAAELAERMVQVLEAQRGQGPGAYPLTLQRLQALADPQANERLVKRAVATEPFMSQAVLAGPSKPATLVALATDRPALAADPRLLEAALAAVYPKKKPAAQTVARIAAKVAPELRPAFEEAVHRRIREQSLPPNLGTLDRDGTARLYFRDRPPEEVVVRELAAKLVQALRARREHCKEDYPLPLPQLIELAAPSAPPRVLKKALAHPDFRAATVLAIPKDAATPVALAGDVYPLAASRQVLELLLAKARKPAVHAFPLKTLKKPLVPSLQQPFEEAVNRQADTGSLPPTVGALWIKTRHLFLTRDVHTPAHAPADGQRVPAPPGDFAARFSEAFDRLDRQSGGRNFVSLVDLRRALPAPRDVFDAKLFQLRRAGRYSLSAAEGRHGISPEEREAGIPEEGSLLLFVSRNGQ